MKKELVIHEKYMKYWPAIAAVSLIFAIVFFVAYNMMENVLWVGYLRLAAFAFFAVSLLSFFKVKDGQVQIAVSVKDDLVKSVYKVRDEIVLTEERPLSDFYKLKIDQMPDKSLYNDFMKSDKCVRFRRENESAWFYFHEIDSRVIPLSKENAERLYNFLEQNRES